MMPSARLPIATLVLPLLLATAATLSMSGCKDESAADPAANPASKDGAKAPAAKAEETPEQKAQREDGFGAKLAGNFTSCYAKFEVNGAVDGRLMMAVGSDGAVVDVSYQGAAPEPVQQCLLDLIRSNSLEDYEGEPGVAQFTYSAPTPAAWRCSPRAGRSSAAAPSRPRPRRSSTARSAPSRPRSPPLHPSNLNGSPR